MFGTECAIGYDPSMTRDNGDKLLTITIAEKVYDVVKKIFTSETLRGRATQCWKVRRDGKDFVIKDAWIQTERQTNEIDMLRRVVGTPCAPTIIEGEDLVLPCGTADSTAIIRVGLEVKEGPPPEERLHQHILMEPHGESLFTFKSKKELVGAMIDVIQGT
jgi:hypothetical protein